MNPRLEAAWEIHQFLAEHGLKYAIVGGIAVQRWSEPRFTRDVDLSVASPTSAGSADLVRLITERFPSRSAAPLDFARRTRMILVTASNGVDVDISLALPGYEDQLFAGTVDYEIESPEDLIIHKAVAGRPQDVSDIQGVIYRQGEKLDTAYIRRWLAAFAEALADPEVQERFEAAGRSV